MRSVLGVLDKLKAQPVAPKRKSVPSSPPPKEPKSAPKPTPKPAPKSPKVQTQTSEMKQEFTGIVKDIYDLVRTEGDKSSKKKFQRDREHAMGLAALKRTKMPLSKLIVKRQRDKSNLRERRAEDALAGMPSEARFISEYEAAKVAKQAKRRRNESRETAKFFSLRHAGRESHRGYMLHLDPSLVSKYK
ncbi:MAG: hypothetical protein KVP17_002967 [Porospora cf. gigantea B]|uniref:uncharacterized protein n=1 Tax=Porospora cf. gigantea B TaxID=2853592 RepID=UPI003571FB4E|nr:MAG: hypothetical protein KVP17_002967 [Porospora cf. gigantea B]